MYKGKKCRDCGLDQPKGDIFNSWSPLRDWKRKDRGACVMLRPNASVMRREQSATFLTAPRGTSGLHVGIGVDTNVGEVLFGFVNCDAVFCVMSGPVSDPKVPGDHKAGAAEFRSALVDSGIVHGLDGGVRAGADGDGAAGAVQASDGPTGAVDVAGAQEGKGAAAGADGRAANGQSLLPGGQWVAACKSASRGHWIVGRMSGGWVIPLSLAGPLKDKKFRPQGVLRLSPLGPDSRQNGSSFPEQEEEEDDDEEDEEEEEEDEEEEEEKPRGAMAGKGKGGGKGQSAKGGGGRCPPGYWTIFGETPRDETQRDRERDAARDRERDRERDRLRDELRDTERDQIRDRERDKQRDFYRDRERDAARDAARDRERDRARDMAVAQSRGSEGAEGGVATAVVGGCSGWVATPGNSHGPREREPEADGGRSMDTGGHEPGAAGGTRCEGVDNALARDAERTVARGVVRDGGMGGEEGPATAGVTDEAKGCSDGGLAVTGNGDMVEDGDGVGSSDAKSSRKRPREDE